MMKRFLIGLSAIFLVFALAGPAPAAEPIKIGVAGAHSGDLASYGLPTVKAVELVVKDVNARGGILGRKIVLLIEDDVCKPEVATNTATKLISQKVDVVIGHICSGATKTALGIYKDAKVVTVSPSATNPELTQSGRYPNFFRTIASDDAQARLGVEFARKFITDGKKARVVLFEGVTPGAVDYSAVVNKVRQSGAEAVIYGGYHPEASSIIAQMRKKNMKTLFISDDGVKDDTFIKVAGRYAEGVYASGPKDTKKNPLAIAAIAAHKKAYNSDPGAFFLEGYAAALAVVNAIQKAKSTEYNALVKALRTNYVNTPVGKIRFDNRGDAIGVGFAMYQVKNGAYIEVR
jgi:branched-chain amino acid transport system substrate-binding protein